MKKLTKSEYNKIIQAKILSTGDYKNRLVSDAEEDTELYWYLMDLKTDYKKGDKTLINADAEIAFNFLKFADDDLLADINDLYGSYIENQSDINNHFRWY